ncbi:unnamed protein product, partial [Mesorhabditis belari]|uniref:Uncharacterized protein n=1 Tax=Mesorhabditis belari TaxID=2138241 RepID=A0AAF3EJE2_9BILA
MIISSLLFIFISSTRSFPTETSNQIEIPEQVPTINGTVYTISSFSPKTFVRTDEFLLNYTSCAQFHFKLTEKRVRLRGYTCLLTEGGFCTLDKFYYPRDKEGCYALRPWKAHPERFAFYFVLERRQRKYGAAKAHRARKIRRSGRVSAEPIGELILDGIMPCSETCTKGQSRPTNDRNTLN